LFVPIEISERDWTSRHARYVSSLPSIPVRPRMVLTVGAAPTFHALQACAFTGIAKSAELELDTGIEPAISCLRGRRVTFNTFPARMVHPRRFARRTVANQATVILISPRVVCSQCCEHRMVGRERLELSPFCLKGRHATLTLASREWLLRLDSNQRLIG
jgi:hypothetical protein